MLIGICASSCFSWLSGLHPLPEKFAEVCTAPPRHAVCTAPEPRLLASALARCPPRTASGTSSTLLAAPSGGRRRCRSCSRCFSCAFSTPPACSSARGCRRALSRTRPLEPPPQPSPHSHSTRCQPLTRRPKSLVPAQAGLVDEQTGQLPGTRAAFLGASLATGLGGILGTSPVIILNETCAVTPANLPPPPAAPQPRTRRARSPAAPSHNLTARLPNHLQVRRNRRGW